MTLKYMTTFPGAIPSSSYQEVGSTSSSSIPFVGSEEKNLSNKITEQLHLRDSHPLEVDAAHHRRTQSNPIQTTSEMPSTRSSSLEDHSSEFPKTSAEFHYQPFDYKKLRMSRTPSQTTSNAGTGTNTPTAMQTMSPRKQQQISGTQFDEGQQQKVFDLLGRDKDDPLYRSSTSSTSSRNSMVEEREFLENALQNDLFNANNEKVESVSDDSMKRRLAKGKGNENSPRNTSENG